MPKFKINFDWLKATLTLGLIAFVVLFLLQQLILYIQVAVLNTGIVAIVVAINIGLGKVMANHFVHKLFHPDPPKKPLITIRLLFLLIYIFVTAKLISIHFIFEILFPVFLIVGLKYCCPPEKPKEKEASKEPKIDLDAIKKNLTSDLSLSEDLKRLSNCEVNYLKKIIDDVAKNSADKAELDTKKAASNNHKSANEILEAKVRNLVFIFFLLGNLFLTFAIFILFHFKTGIELIKNFL